VRGDVLRRAAALAVGLLCFAPARLDADTLPVRPPLLFLADPDLSTDPGVRTTISLSRIFYRYDEALRSDTHEPDLQARILGGTGRTLKVAFLDAPLASMMTTFAHEVFGHGARAREQGVTATYKLRIPEPYRTIFGQRGGLSGEAYFARQDQVDRDLALVSGGIEADYRSAYFLERDLVLHQGWAHYGDMLMYAAARLSYVRSFTSRANHLEGFDDVNNYVGLLQQRFNRWTKEDRASFDRGIETGYLWNLLDPTLAFAVYAVGTHIATGRQFVRAPLPEAGGVTFLPWPSIALSPFGLEHGLTLFVARDDTLVQLAGRLGSSHLASYGGVGAEVSGLHATDFLEVAVGADGWAQPEIFLDTRNSFERPNRVGGNVTMEGRFALSGRTEAVMAVACKTRGFLPGRPLGGGLYGYTGLAWRVPEPDAGTPAR